MPVWGAIVLRLDIAAQSVQAGGNEETCHRRAQEGKYGTWCSLQMTLTFPDKQMLAVIGMAP